MGLHTTPGRLPHREAMRLVVACLVAALPARSFRVACGRARWTTRASAADSTAYGASEPSAADPITTVLCTELAVDVSEAQRLWRAASAAPATSSLAAGRDELSAEHLRATFSAIHRALGGGDAEVVKTRAALRRVARQSPAILHPSATTSMTETVGVLQNLGLTPKHLRTAVVRWPALLTVHPDRILATSTYLANELDFGQLAIASLYRQAPFLLEHDAMTRFEPVSEFLQSWGINQTQSVVFAYPRVSARGPSVTPAAPQLTRAARPRTAQVLLADPSTELLPRIRFLIEEVGIDSADIPRVRLRTPFAPFACARFRPQLTLATQVIISFPVIFGISLKKQMIPTLQFLRDLGIADADVVKVRLLWRGLCYVI